jgi:hypothetical protein
MRIAHKDLSGNVRRPQDGWIKAIARADYIILPAAQALTVGGAATIQEIRSIGTKPPTILLWVTISAAKPSRADGLEYEDKRRRILLGWDHRYPDEWPSSAKRVDGAPAVSWQNAAGEQALLVDPYDRHKIVKHANTFSVVADNIDVHYDGVILDYVRDPIWGPWLNPEWNDGVTDLDMDKDGKIYPDDWTEQSAWWAWDISNLREFRKKIGDRSLWVNGPLDVTRAWGSGMASMIDGHYWELYEKLPYSNAINFYEEYTRLGDDLDAILEAVPGKPCAERDARVTGTVYQRPAGKFNGESTIIMGGTTI